MKKKPKLHFNQVPLKDIERLIDKKAAGLGASPGMSFRRPATKTEPRSIPFAVDSKKSR